jgi:hypothetical protein
VIEPDHPLVFDGPDVLLSTPGNITALFVPNFVEKKNPARLGSRLIATRLAYPTETRCVLVQLEHDLADTFRYDFDLLISGHDRSAASRLVNRGEVRPTIGDDLQRNTIRRFDRALRASLLSYKWQRAYERSERRPPSLEGDLWSDWGASLESHGPIAFRDRGLRQKHRYLLHQVPVVLAGQKSKAALLKQTRYTADLQFLSDFGLDNGIPYPKTDGENITVLVADDWSNHFDETSKAVVATAFAGVAIAPAAAKEIVEAFIDKLPKLRRTIEPDSISTFDDDEE